MLELYALCQDACYKVTWQVVFSEQEYYFLHGQSILLN